MSFYDFFIHTVLSFVKTNPHLVVIWGIVLLLGLFYAPLKGFIGERKIAFFLSSLPKEEYLVLHDVLLSTERGTTQIDHIVFSIFEIFVIETKNFKGWIYGEEHEKYWVQSLHSKKYRFFSPILQNKGHINALRHHLSEFSSLPFFSIVAFSDSCELKTRYETQQVVKMSQLKKAIMLRQYPLISPKQVHEIYQVIKRDNITDPSSRRKHIKSVQAKKLSME